MDIGKLLNPPTPIRRTPSPFVRPCTPQQRRENAPDLTRSDRVRIRTALDFNIPFSKIRAKYGFAN